MEKVPEKVISPLQNFSEDMINILANEGYSIIKRMPGGAYNIHVFWVINVFHRNCGV